MKTTKFKNTCLRLNGFAARPWRCAAFCALWVIVQGSLCGQDFMLDWFALAGGGGDSSGVDFELSATIGQSDADTNTLRGGDFALTGGFWSVVTVVETSNAPALSVRLDQGNDAPEASRES